ncbi:MAG: head-tail connector protein [Roseivivax sp.]|nr:head-tail connector protein [Roseivivax sp.]
MPVTSLALLKQHMALDHDLDDALLSHKLDAAEAWAALFTGTAIPDPAPAPITEAVLQLAAFWYANREAVAMGITSAPVPFGVHALLSPYKESVVGHVAE